LLGRAPIQAETDTANDSAEEVIVAKDVEIDAAKNEEERRAKRDAIISAAQDLPEGQAAFAARQAAERAAEQVKEAMRLAEEAQRAAREAETAATAGVRMPKKDIISSFDAFNDAAAKKRERSKAKKRKHAENDDDEDDEEDKPQISLDQYQERVGKQVHKYVHEQLQDKRDRDIVTKAECKKMEGKIVDKILENSGGVTDTASAFLTSKRKEKIKSLIGAYVQSAVNARSKKIKH